jgi:hypothetical protein
MKKIAPIIITLLISIYLGFYIWGISFVFSMQIGLINKLLLGLFGLVTLGIFLALFYTLFLRLREIKEEDKNDISKY